MIRNRIVCLLLAAAAVFGCAAPALAAEVESDSIYCFSSADFSEGEELTGICITQLPDPAAGTLCLGTRVLQPGDILTAQQLAHMTFASLQTQEDASAAMSYLPIFEDYVAPCATMTIAIRGKEDKAPIAEDSVMETYKNIPNESQLKVSDPEGQALTYTLVRGPKRGEVIIRKDGSVLYTPKKNKVGTDSFTYTATDPAGNVSREATVTVQIVKPTDATQYTDTVGLNCRFSAEWMRNTGLFVGEKVNGAECFYPEKTVSRGEFLAMVIHLLDIPLDEASTAAQQADVPQWLKPYVAAALRSGLTAGIPSEDAVSYDAPITGAEAAVMLQNALDLSVSASAPAQEDAVPAWAADALQVMNGSGVKLEAAAELTRADAAEVLYQVSLLSQNAPGTAVFRVQE